MTMSCHVMSYAIRWSGVCYIVCRFHKLLPSIKLQFEWIISNKLTHFMADACCNSTINNFISFTFTPSLMIDDAWFVTMQCLLHTGSSFADQLQSRLQTDIMGWRSIDLAHQITHLRAKNCSYLLPSILMIFSLQIVFICYYVKLLVSLQHIMNILFI